jgi:hypothetical protein
MYLRRARPGRGSSPAHSDSIAPELAGSRRTMGAPGRGAARCNRCRPPNRARSRRSVARPGRERVHRLVPLAPFTKYAALRSINRLYAAAAASWRRRSLRPRRRSEGRHHAPKRANGAPLATHHDIDVAAPLEARIKDHLQAAHRPRLCTLENQLFSITHQMKCYSRTRSLATGEADGTLWIQRRRCTGRAGESGPRARALSQQDPGADPPNGRGREDQTKRNRGRGSAGPFNREIRSPPA